MSDYDYRDGWFLVSEGFAVHYIESHEGPIHRTFGRTPEQAHEAYQRNYPAESGEAYDSNIVSTVPAVLLEDTSVDYETASDRTVTLTADEWERVRSGETSLDSLFSDSRWIN